MSEISNTGYWKSETAHIHHVYCPPLSKWIINYLKNFKEKPLYDFGCGLGMYLYDLELDGFSKTKGFEGDPPIKKACNNITKQDLEANPNIKTTIFSHLQYIKNSIPHGVAQPAR